MDKPRPGGDPTFESIEQLMRAASTYEELITCWDDIKNRIEALPDNEKESGSLASALLFLHRTFSEPPHECDTWAKEIFENEQLRTALREFHIPEEFLLHTVRIGALKGMLQRVGEKPGLPVELPYDGTMVRKIDEEVDSGKLEDPNAENERLESIIRNIQYHPNLDGYSWANQQLTVLQKERDAGALAAKERSRQHMEARVEEALQRVAKDMRTENFHFRSEDAELLKHSIASKLVRWKGFLEGREGGPLAQFMLDHGEEQITSELYRQIITNVETLFPKGNKPPLEMIDPDSGWFAVLIINKTTTLGSFRQAAHSNMNGWFKL